MRFAIGFQWGEKLGAGIGCGPEFEESGGFLRALDHLLRMPTGLPRDV